MTNLNRTFWKYANNVWIPSKDAGLVRFKPYQTQVYLINELLSGITEGIHEFVVLKPRQIGATTSLAIWDSFWLQAHKGLQGQLVADTDGNREFFRSVITELQKTAPVQFRRKVLQANRNQILWGNQSRLLFQTASANNLGRGRGLAFLHGTEVAFWKGAGNIGQLRAALSERHPAACFVWESTANSFNHFYDMYEDAENAVSVKAIFLPWWRHELYSVPEGSPEYDVYWDGVLTGEERSWQREITRKWNIDITPQQWAWYRWKLAEKIGDEILMKQEYPTIERDAFQASGQPFIGYEAMDRIVEQVSSGPEPECYSYHFGGFIEDMTPYETDASLAQLKVWEQPDPAAIYVVAADPAYGASEDSDMAVCQVWKATHRKLIQVAEFASNGCTMQQFAWVCAHLCGAFSSPKNAAYFILELNGPGMAVHQELQRLQNYGWGTTRRQEFQNALAAIQNYLWNRPDSKAGFGNSWQWKTTHENKVWIFSRLRSEILNDKITMRSADLVKEIGTIRQSGDTFEAEGKKHDDRVVTAALALEMYSGQVMPYLSMTPDPDAPKQDTQAPMVNAQERLMKGFFERIV